LETLGNCGKWLVKLNVMVAIIAAKCSWLLYGITIVTLVRRLFHFEGKL